MALFPGLPGWAGTRKVKPIWILLKQETVSGSGISWAICKSTPRSRQITTPTPHHSVFTGRMPFLPPNQQRQSTEGINSVKALCCTKQQLPHIHINIHQAFNYNTPTSRTDTHTAYIRNCSSTSTSSCSICLLSCANRFL